MAQAQTIDEVLTTLATIIADAETKGLRTGYFTSLYYKVTSKVKEGVANGLFKDGPRMERLDVLFANRYLDALESWQKGGTLTRSWKVALDTTQRSTPLILQQLLLGINAHINLDLGIAAVEVMQGQNLEDIHIDFNTINEIIGSLTNETIREIDRMSPLLSLLGLHADKTDSFLIQFSIGNARDGAWCFAEELSQLKDEACQENINARDADIAKLGGNLVNNGGLLKLTLGIVHLFEWKNPKKIIQELGGGKKLFLKANMFTT